MRSRALTIAGVLIALLVWTGRPAAHDLPADVVVHTFVKPEGQRLRLLVRVPLEAMRDVDYPTRGPEGLLDLTRVDSALADAAALWLVPAFRVQENSDHSGSPSPSRGTHLTAVRSLVRELRRRPSRTSRALPSTPTPGSTGISRCSTSCSSTTSVRTDRAFAFDPALARLGVRVATVAAVPPARRCRSRLRVGRRPWTRPPRSALAPGCLAIRVARVHPHPRRRRPPALPPVPRHPDSPAQGPRARSSPPLRSRIRSRSSRRPSTSRPRALWFPPLIETLIALSIVCMALENMIGLDVRPSLGGGLRLWPRPRLRFLGSRCASPSSSPGRISWRHCSSFNVGVELGQLLVLLLILPPLALVFRHAAFRASRHHRPVGASWRMPRGTGWSTAVPNSPSSASNGRHSTPRSPPRRLAGW